MKWIGPRGNIRKDSKQRSFLAGTAMFNGFSSGNGIDFVCLQLTDRYIPRGLFTDIYRQQSGAVNGLSYITRKHVFLLIQCFRGHQIQLIMEIGVAFEIIGANPASYLIGTGSYFPMGKAAGT